MEHLHKELRFAAVCTLLLDAVLTLGGWLVFRTGYAFPVGLLLGSAGMLGNLLLLRRSIQNAVYHGKTKDMPGYLLRCLIASAVMAAGLLSVHVSAAGAVLPFLYPKLIFGILSMRSPTKKSGGQKPPGKNGGM